VTPRERQREGAQVVYISQPCAADQDGARVVLALPAMAPYQDPMSRATTGGLATVTVREHSSRADAWPVPSAPSLRAGPLRCRGARTTGGPTVPWSSHHGWDRAQDKGVGPRWSHGADFTRKTRDQRGTTALVLVPRVVPWTRLVWSHRIGLVVPQNRPYGATPARPVAPQ